MRKEANGNIASRTREKRGNRNYIYLLFFFLPIFFAINCWGQAAPIPAPAYVNDGLTPPDVDFTNSTTSLSANWAPITQYVDGYECAIGTEQGADDVVRWTNVGNVTSTTLSTPTLNNGMTYYFSVRGWRSTEKGEVATSDGITVDTIPPSSQVNKLNPITESLSFTVSWSGMDDGGGEIPRSRAVNKLDAAVAQSGGASGILNYDVQYMDVGTEIWTDWQMATTATSATFTGQNGHTYYFRCRARDKAGNLEDWPSAPDTQTTINIGAVSLTVVATPSALSYSAGENSKSVTFGVTATGPQGVNLTTLIYRREYSDGTSEEIPVVISQRIEAGARVDITRDITIDDATRTRVLAGKTTGTFDLVATFRGNDDSGNAVSGSTTISVEIRSGAPEVFTVSNLRVQFTATSPFAIGQEVRGKILLDASGSVPGDVKGVIYLDGNSWRSFGVRIKETGENEFDSDLLPTSASDVGKHTIRVEIVDPTALSAEANYEVSSEAQIPAFNLSELILIVDTAKLSDFHFSSTEREGNTNRYTLNGTAKLTLISLDNQQVENVNIENLKIAYNNSDPKNSEIRSGRVIKEVDETAEPLFKKWKDCLVIRKVEYNYPEGSPTRPDFLSLSGMLHLPYLEQDLYQINDLHMNKDGIVGKDFHTNHEWNVFGFVFSIKDIGSAPSISIGKDSSGYYISLSGELSVNMRGGSPHKIAQYSNFKFAYNRSTNDFNIAGTFNITDPFGFIPGNNYLELKTLQFAKETDTWFIKVSCKFHKENLPNGVNDLLQKIPTLPENVEFKFSKGGNIEGKIALLNELGSGGPGHHLNYDFAHSRTSSADPTEYCIPKIDYVLDPTYIAINLKWENGEFVKDQSSIEFALDLYLPKFKDDSGNWVEDENRRRVQVGDVNASGAFTPGVRISMDGGVEWNAPTITVVKGLRYSFCDDKILLRLNELAFQVYPFVISINGSLGVDFSMIEGGIDLGLNIDLDGNVDWKLGGGGHFDIVNVVHIGVDKLDFWGGPEPKEITLNMDTTTGEGTGRSFSQSGDQKIQVKRYFKFDNASIDLGKQGSWFHGSVEQFLIYTTTAGDTKVSIRHADVSIAGVSLLSDYDYHNPMLRVAGKATVPSGQEITIVGKLGWGADIGDMTFGLFGAVGGLTIQLGPVTLTDVGGGFFYNPVAEDLETVRYMCKFNRPEMEERIQSRRPGGADNPGKFAVLLYAGAVIASDDLVKGKALITLTEHYFNLDAEVAVLPSANLAKGVFYLGVGWSPFYAEGSIDMEVNAVDIITGKGHLDFYVYSGDAWGIMGNANLKVIRIINVTAELFVGNPGFMFDGKVGAGIDLYIVSGGFELETMFWYKRSPPTSWGAYAKGRAWGDVLGGLIGAEISLEGALIHTSPDFIIYTVGGLKVEICWVTVFKGSVWVALSTEDGIDGGTGRNSRYDELIDEARDTANEMEEEKNKVEQEMEEAKRAYDKLSDEQRRIAGNTVIQPDEEKARLVSQIYNTDMGRFGARIPDVLKTIWSQVIDGTEAENLAKTRTQLLNSQNEIDQMNQQMIEKYNAVVEKINQYSALLQAELPSIRELGEMGTPFQGYSEQTVTTSDGSSRTIRVGFNMDWVKADQQAQDFQEVKEQSAAYEQRLLQLVGQFEDNIQKLDGLLHWEDPAVAPLASDYYQAFQKINNHYRTYLNYLQDNFASCTRRLNTLYTTTNETTLRDILHTYAFVESNFGSSQVLKQWTKERIDSINSLLGKTRGEEGAYNPILSDSDPMERWREVWVDSGLELWYRVPRAGLRDFIEVSYNSKSLEAENSFKNIINIFCPPWKNYTDSLDSIYIRKARLYEILYDLYDQLALCDGGLIRISSLDGISPNLPGMQLRNSQVMQRLQGIMRGGQEIRRLEGTGGTGGPIVGPRPLPAVGTVAISGEIIGFTTKKEYFTLKKEETALYLVVPEIVSFTGEAIASNRGYVDLNLYWNANHPYKDDRYPERSGVVEYSWAMKYPTDASFYWVYGVPSPPPGIAWYSVGKAKTLSLPLFSWALPQQHSRYEVRLRARGAGGYTIERRGIIEINLLNPTPNQRTILDTSDSTPPITPVVQVKGPLTASSGEMWGRWWSADPESGIQEYQYKIVRVLDSGSELPNSTIRAYADKPQPQPLIGGGTVQSGAKTSGGMKTSGSAVGSKVPGVEAAQSIQVLQTVDLIPWTSAGGMTEMNIRELSLEHNRRYKLLVRAKNGAGLWSAVGESIPVKVDLTPPDPPYNASIRIDNLFGYPTTSSSSSPLIPSDKIMALPVSGGVQIQGSSISGMRGSTIETINNGKALQFQQTETFQILQQAEEKPFVLRLSWEWDIYNDKESGISGHRYAIGTAPDNTEILNWTDLPLPATATNPAGRTTSSVSIVEFPARSGATYYLRVRSVNGCGVAGDERVVSVICHLEDSTPPTPPVVNILRQPPPMGASPSAIHWETLRPLKILWLQSNDMESGIYEYKCAVGKSAGADDVVPWTSVGRRHEFNLPDSLPYGTLFFSVKAINGAGLETVSTVSLRYSPSVQVKPVETGPIIQAPSGK